VRQLDVKGADGELREASTVSGNATWTTSQTPTSIARLAAEPRDLSLSEMRRFMQPGNSGAKPSFAYSFWHAHRLTRPLAALILLMACAAMMQRTGREDTGDKTLILGITMGFVFLVIDGAMATFAASGGLSPGPAIAMPLLAFGLLSAFLLTRTEAL
jgi:lipopolysaccharide export LptBFGC system permease protein LptF